MKRSDIVPTLEEQENLLTLTMQQVRDAWGYAKLGIHVRRQISNDLRGMGIGHYPVDLPEYQHQFVRLYKLGTSVARIHEAVLNPSVENDHELRQMAGGDARATLDKIKALVCE